MGVDAAAALKYVCLHLGEVQQVLADDGVDQSTPLGRLLAACGSGHVAAEGLDLTGLLAEVDAALREMTDGLVGLHGFGTGRGGDWSGLEPMEIVYRCPLRRCTGRPGGEVAEARPVCSISRRELVRERLL
ncbi:hypothetical protein ACF9IK_00545 [Kitasatospora hibisci]|uniref:hypothetical protein n=1 Tax=Kitasatospora hibisci TaxID=3369522 RepID=UPI0037545795